ncbi:MAG: tRNA (adenosine(37)-N6)-threonylcarbamoyltransferase complex transferase subunit TsaD, partial [bacterium]|nr:tRNA (adenosine(37)-N6)-threonylcarbamoyltransferase complex transferase subunit TsaD [bacterium]
DFVINDALVKAAKNFTGPVESFLPASARHGNHDLRAVGNPSSLATRKISCLFSKIDCIAVTYGPGLAIALEVGINKAIELALKYKKKIIPVNHMEGHIFSSFAQNSAGNPKKSFDFPYLALLVSGGHTELVLWKDYLNFKILGETVDDAAGEALDKASKMLGLGYPGGALIERLAEKIDNKDFYNFPRPMRGSKDLNFSFSGLKTSFYYLLKDMKEKEKVSKLNDLVSSFQEAVFDSIIIKTRKAIMQTGVKKVVLGGGVSANKRLKFLLHKLVKENSGELIYPKKDFCTDNAAMIGVAAHYKAKAGIFVKNFSTFERQPRLSLNVI